MTEMNQIKENQTLKNIVEVILKNTEDETIQNCFFCGEGIEPFRNGFYYDGQEDTYNALQEAGITTELEDSYGGEGKGDEYWSVYKFSKVDETVYVKFDGWYASYNGAEFSKWFFVEPKEVKVIEFVRLK